MSESTLNEFAAMLDLGTPETIGDVEDATEEVEVEENLEETEEAEEEGAEEPESEEDAEEAPEELDEPETTPDDDTYYPETLDDLIDAYDGDGDKLKSIYVASKKNGEKVTLDQVLSNWEIGESAVRKSQEASNAKKALDDEREQFQATVVGKLEEQETILSALEKLYKEHGQAELEAIRTSDPAEFAARKAELADRDSMLNKVKAKIVSDKEELLNTRRGEDAAKYTGYLEAQATEMFTIIPEWKDNKVFNEEYSQISEYMQGVGYSPDDLTKIVDAKSRKVIRDAMLYNRIKTKAAPKKKRVVKRPRRAVRVGNSKKSNKTTKDFDMKMKSAANSRNNRVKASAIAELLGNI